MMLRTPPPSKRPRSPQPDSQLVPLQSLPLTSASPLLDDEHIGFDFDEVDGDARCSYKCKQMVKSELLETLDKQGKQIVELNAQLQSLKDSALAEGVERRELMERIKRYEQEEAAFNARERALQEKYKLDLERTETRFRDQLKRCEDLEIKLQEEMRSRVEAELKSDAAMAEMAALEDSSAKHADKLKREISQLEERLRRMQKDSHFAVSRSQMEISAEKSKLQSAEREIEVIKAQCEELQQRLSKCMDENNDLSHQLAAATVQAASPSHQDRELIIKHLQDELRSFKADVEEARKVKQFYTNVNLLKEKLENERLRAERAEAALEKVADHEVKVRSLEVELQQWRSLLHEIPDVERREDILTKVGGLQRELLHATAKVEQLTAKVLELKTSLEREEAKRLEAEKIVTSSREAVDDTSLQITRLKRKLELLTKENEGLKAVLASYEQEENMMHLTRPGHEEVQISSGQAKEKRIQFLEALVEDLRREGDILRSELSAVELKLGRGGYDPSRTKVVHMVENLDVNAEKQVLLREIQSLREKVKALQDDAVDSGITASKNAELSALREQVSSLEKKETRYKKVFAEKISVFRQACCLLFGYTIEMNEEQQPSTGMTVTLFTLQSIYTQNEEETLEFQFESNHMNLLANDYTSSPQISLMVDVYLKKFKSIPAFTANLTSELFNRTTLN